MCDEQSRMVIEFNSSSKSSARWCYAEKVVDSKRIIIGFLSKSDLIERAVRESASCTLGKLKADGKHLGSTKYVSLWRDAIRDASSVSNFDIRVKVKYKCQSESIKGRGAYLYQKIEGCRSKVNVDSDGYLIFDLNNNVELDLFAQVFGYLGRPESEVQVVYKVIKRSIAYKPDNSRVGVFA